LNNLTPKPIKIRFSDRQMVVFQSLAWLALLETLDRTGGKINGLFGTTGVMP
jgi:hypothetical protein